MKEYQRKREQMVKKQIVNRGIKKIEFIKAFSKVPREKFVPEQEINQAYGDHPLPIGYGQTISQPYIVALMTEALNPHPDDYVLEIGTGSGYQTAILCELVKHVYSLERISQLAEQAEQTLKELGYVNFDIKSDGKLIYDHDTIFDKIIVTAAAQQVPTDLLAQLKEGGIMVIPIGNEFFQELLVYKKEHGDFKKSSLGGCRFVPLK